MKCIKCTEKNINKANYCKKCAYKFSKKEQEIARQHTSVGKLELIEKIYNVCKLKIITDHILFKIFSILFVLGVGIYVLIQDGIDLKLLNSKNYEIQYNTKQDEFYLISDEEKVPLNPYVPNRVENIEISHYSKEDELVEKIEYNKKDKIVLEAHTEDYYILNVNYLHASNEKIKIYVFEKE